ncbi:MAG: type IIL restriction-modification enzyme MmeI, partial [archaeon]
NLPAILERINKVKEHRQKSKRGATLKLAQTPYLFGEIRQPKSKYLLIPLVSSEKREYIPMAFMEKGEIANNSCATVEGLSVFQFGVLTSRMHMTWMSQIGGRLEGRFRYSNDVIYNTFPWPEPSATSKKKIETLVGELLAERKSHLDKGETYAGLYDPLRMPKTLRTLHTKLDREIEKLYTKKSLKTDLERLEILFELYTKYTNKNQTLVQPN